MKRQLALPLILLSAACGEEEALPERPTVVRFSASDSRVDPGQRFLLEWQVEGADSVTVATGDGELIVGGSEDLDGRAMAGPLLADTTFTLRAEGPGGRAGASLLVTVDYPAPRVERFEAQPSVIIEGDDAFLFWETENGTNLHVADHAGALVYSGPMASGSATVTPSEDTLYTLTLTGPGGTATATASVDVRGAPPRIVAFSAEPPEIFEGDESRLSWRTVGATELRILDGGGAELVRTSSTIGTLAVRPSVDTTYELIADSPDGEARDTVDVRVRVLEAPKLENLQASPAVAALGGQTTLSWVQSGPERYRVFANGQLVLEQPAVGENVNEPVTVTSTRTTFRVEVENRVGSAAAEVEVLGHRAPSVDTFTVTPAAQRPRGTVTVTWAARDVAALDLLRDGAPAAGFTPVRAGGPTVDAQGTLTFDLRDLAHFELVATSAGGEARAEQLVVIGAAEQENNDTPALATSLTGTVGRVLGALSSPQDVDYFRLDVPDDGRVFAQTLTGKGLCDLDTRLTLTGTDGATVLLSDDGDGVGACGRLDPDVDSEVLGLPAGFYYLKIEAGTATSAGAYALEFESRKPICGDGRVEGTELCDDGNQSSGDGCSPTCAFELAGTVTGAGGLVSTSHPGGAALVVLAVDVSSPGQTILARANDPGSQGCNTVETRLRLVAADGTRLGEKADGGATGPAGTCAAFSVPPDVFAADLAVGRYYVVVLSDNGASGAVEVPVTLRNPACGNAVTEGRAGEQCDDGNLVSGDGCSATCRLEAATLPEAEPNDTQASAFVTGLTGPGTVTVEGANDPGGDDDVFAFSVPANTTLNLAARTYSTRGVPTSCDSQTTDTRIYVEQAGVEATTPNSGELAFDDDIDNANNVWCSEITGLALAGGASGATYYVRVQGWRDLATTTYFLRLQLSP